MTAVVRHSTLRSPKLLRFFGGHVLAVSTVEAVHRDHVSSFVSMVLSERRRGGGEELKREKYVGV